MYVQCNIREKIVPQVVINMPRHSVTIAIVAAGPVLLIVVMVVVYYTIVYYSIVHITQLLQARTLYRVVVIASHTLYSAVPNVSGVGAPGEDLL